MKELNADVGFAYDGDADRLIAVDENGREVDGDEIIFIIARELLKKGKLNKKKVVCTVLSNMGVERNLNSMGVSMLRVDVGDHNVQAAMAKGGYVLGGEQSGHIILGEFAATGDGLLASVISANQRKFRREKQVGSRKKQGFAKLRFGNKRGTARGQNPDPRKRHGRKNQTDRRGERRRNNEQRVQKNVEVHKRKIYVKTKNKKEEATRNALLLPDLKQIYIRFLIYQVFGIRRT